RAAVERLAARRGVHLERGGGGADGTGGAARPAFDEALRAEYAARVGRRQPLPLTAPVNADVDRARDDQETRAALAALGENDGTFRQVPAPHQRQQLAQFPARELGERRECLERLDVD